jgi:hypothetical protein
MSFSALDRYYVKLFEVNLDFLFFIVKKRLNNMARQHTIPWNKVCAILFKRFLTIKNKKSKLTSNNLT